MSKFTIKLNLATASLCLLALITGSLIGTVNAQTTLQGAQSGLQQQTGQAQPSVSTQDQTGSVQNTNQSSLLDRKSSGSLGVVSSPNQVTPEVTVSPSSNLKTDISQTERSSKKPLFIIVGSLLVVVIGVIILRRPTNTPQIQIEAKPIVKPEPLKIPKKSKKSTRKQRKRR